MTPQDKSRITQHARRWRDWGNTFAAGSPRTLSDYLEAAKALNLGEEATRARIAGNARYFLDCTYRAFQKRHECAGSYWRDATVRYLVSARLAKSVLAEIEETNH